MTRKIRFSPFVVAGVFAGTVLLAATNDARAADVPFVAQPPITTAADGAHSVFSADVDGDGDLDALSASEYNGAIAWHENTAGDGAAWTAHTVATGPPGVSEVSVFAADLDGDGDLDALTASGFNGVVWHENTAGDGSAWTPRTISTAPGASSVFAADLDGDGDMDVLCGSVSAPGVGWYENTAGNGSAWATHTITTAVAVVRSVSATDVDGDGDMDVLAVSFYTNTVAWYENTAGNGSAWTTHTIYTLANRPRSVFAADVDGDGDMDALSVSYYDSTVAWYENTAGNGSAWTTHIISTAASAAFSVFAADLDGDGDTDALSASGGDDKVAWYENTAGNGSAWTAHTISTAANGARSVFAADVDGDGDADVLSASFFDDKVAWYRNETIHSSACFAAESPVTSSLGGGASLFGADVDADGDADVLSASSTGAVWHENAAGDGSAWTTHAIATLPDGAFAVSAADVDGDGDLDALATLATSASMVWYENAAGDGSAWTLHGIGQLGGYILSLSAADIDGDGDLDALVGRHLFMPYNDVGWWENTAGDGTAWTGHLIAGGVPLPYSTIAADMDRDGDLDVLYLSRGTGMLAWSENTAGNGSAWTDHYITFQAYGISSASAADVDGDGDLDALATSDVDDWLVWYENTAGDGSAWTTHTITFAADGAKSVFAADLDEDGDVDVIVAERDAGAVAWYENAAGNGTAWTTHAISSVAAGVVPIFAADVDGDGRGDVLSASATNAVAWHPNRGGQFSLTTADMAPPMAPDSALVPMLRIEAAHLGRAGDHDLELASLGLLFEQAPGVPLSTAQANALIESLRVYLDTNVNGAFDPASDTLVTSLPTLALTAGVQTVTFADGDPNTQVAAGTPRAFFVVVELTADASQQSPNQLRVTHLGLGPSASTAEDRDFDLPLRPACPSDATSGLFHAGQALFAVTATKTVAGAFHEGGAVSYAVTVTNVGTNPQPDTPADELADTVPSSLTVAGADDGGNPGTVSVAGNTVRWNGLLPAASFVTVTIQATINPGTAGTVISNQGTITYDSDGNGTGDATHPTDDPALPGAADPTSFTPVVGLKGDLVHGSDRVLDLAASRVAAVDLFGFRQEPRSSYEVVVDGTTGDIGSGGSGPALDLVAADGVSVVASSTAAGAGPSRSLGFENAAAGAVVDQSVRVQSQGCTTDCTAEDRYRLRAWDTTLSGGRFNNSATQVTLLVLQNTTGATVTGNVWLSDSAGALAGSVPFTIAARGSLALNTSTVAPGVGGTLTVSHVAPHGALVGKTVAVEPATGFTFDTPLLPRPR